MAKSGSHILEQYLAGLEMVAPLTFTDIHPIRTQDERGQPRPAEDVLKDLERLQGGDMSWGYVPSSTEYEEWFDRPDVVGYFISRDPRDKIISHIFYAMDIHLDHAMHGYYHELPNIEERISATISGVPGFIEDIRSTYESYLGWFDHPRVQVVKFEDLVNEQRSTLERMLDHLAESGVKLRVNRDEAIQLLIQAMAPEHSPTFRKGSSGGWRDHFSPKNVREFKAVAGDLLIRLDYEQSSDWS